MEHFANIFTGYALPTIFVLGLLIFIHELGHFILAKLVGIRVERFSLGFPPRLIGKKIGDTDYCISAIPLGGYVKMAGMIDESMDSDGIKGEPDEFMSKPIWARVLVISAGPIFNILLAIAIFAAAFYMTGVAEPVGPVVEQVFDNTPAQKIGLQKGDIIRKIDDKPIRTWDDLIAIIHHSAGKELNIEWERNGEILSAKVVPIKDEIQNIGLIGFSPKSEIKPVGLFRAIKLGAVRSWELTALLGRSLKLIFTGTVSVGEGLAGPVRIAQMAGESAKSGFGNLMMFAALLSLNLGLINIFPFPVLDGGHLVMLAIEGITGRPLSVKVKLAIQQVGMVLLLALMAFIIFKDITHVF